MLRPNRIEPTPAQAPIVAHRDGAALVLAGAGSGKTATIAARIASMIDEGYDPRRFLIMTFSRKAAGEMRERVRLYADESRCRGLTIETYHAFGYKLMREAPEQFGRRRGVTVVDQGDQWRLLREVARQCEFSLAESSRRSLLRNASRGISLAKNMGLRVYSDPDQVREYVSSKVDACDEDLDRLMGLFRRYEDWMGTINCVDFDDLCLLTSLGLRRDREFAERIASKYSHATIDESQDTCVVQYQMIRSIFRPGGNVMMVGDDAQAIYAFRGASQDNLSTFISEYEPQRYSLQQNFRSIPAVVTAAGELIANNRQLSHGAFSQVVGDGGVRVETAADASGASELLGSAIARLLEGGTPPNDIAVLFRTTRLARLAESACAARGVPYRIAGGNSMFETLEGKAALGAARLLFNPRDYAALAAVAEIYDPLTDSLLKMVSDYIATQSGSVFDALNLVGAKGQVAAVDLRDRLEVLRHYGPGGAGAWVVARDGLDMVGHYERRIQRARVKGSDELEKERERREETLRLIDCATKQALYARAKDRLGEDPPADRLQEILGEDECWSCLVESRIEDRDEDVERAEGVALSTIHRAKGLEWGHVFILGASEGILPVTPESDVEGDDEGDGGGIEEERRLAYVALTRARRCCVWIHAAQMFPYAKKEGFLMPSRFIREMRLAKPPAVPAAGDTDPLEDLPEFVAPARPATSCIDGPPAVRPRIKLNL